MSAHSCMISKVWLFPELSLSNPHHPKFIINDQRRSASGRTNGASAINKSILIVSHSRACALLRVEVLISELLVPRYQQVSFFGSLLHRSAGFRPSGQTQSVFRPFRGNKTGPLSPNWRYTCNHRTRNLTNVQVGEIAKMSGQSTGSDLALKRRKVRKGTHSCWECKHHDIVAPALPLFLPLTAGEKVVDARFGASSPWMTTVYAFHVKPEAATAEARSSSTNPDPGHSPIDEWLNGWKI